MPLKPGSDHATISKNIHEMVKAGHPQRVAVAAALANARKHKMAKGGLVDDAQDMSSDQTPNAAPSAEAAPMYDKPSTEEYGGTTPNQDPHEDRNIVELNDEAKHESDQDLAEAIRHYADGGEVTLEQPEYDGNESVGNKPGGTVSATGEPMSSMPSKPGESMAPPAAPSLQEALGEAVMNVITERKKSRRYK